MHKTYLLWPFLNGFSQTTCGYCREPEPRWLGSNGTLYCNEYCEEGSKDRTPDQTARGLS